jgi:hypothetical protein
MGGRITLSLLGIAAALGCAAPALAYRPFDGTDAAVAAPGEVEIELGPAGLLRQGSERTLVAPALILNLGLIERWEAVLQGQGQTALPPAATRASLVGNGAFLKGVLREGVLQDKAGPSVATEFGLLLPGINDEPGLGGSIAGIVSQRVAGLTAHLNVQAGVSRQRRADLFLSTILEGPADWPVRPVAEIAYEREFGGEETLSGLIGAIWQPREGLAFDIGLREGRVNDRSLTEFRLGLTFSFAAWRVGER